MLKVIKGEDAKRYGEASLKTEEEGCHVCGVPGHFYRSCKHYNKEFSVEANRKYFLKNQSKKEKKRGHEEEKTSNDRGAPRGGGGGGGGHGNTKIVVEAGEPITLLPKAELPARRPKLSKPDSRGSSILMGLITPTWMPRR